MIWIVGHSTLFGGQLEGKCQLTNRKPNPQSVLHHLVVDISRLRVLTLDRKSARFLVSEIAWLRKLTNLIGLFKRTRLPRTLK